MSYDPDYPIVSDFHACFNRNDTMITHETLMKMIDNFYSLSPNSTISLDDLLKAQERFYEDQLIKSSVHFKYIVPDPVELWRQGWFERYFNNNVTT